MLKKTIHLFGKNYILTGDEIDKYLSLTPLFKEEESFILKLKTDYSLEVREDLLILFINMYLHRFAIPYYQIMHNSFPSIENINFLKEVLYYCMVGRAVDDIVDNDSHMFHKYESVLIHEVYGNKLKELIPQNKYLKFQKYLIESAKYESPKIEEENLQFSHLKKDVFIRIKYFFLLSEFYSESCQKRLSQYIGILLSSLDLNDAIADGYLKESSTVISNHLHRKFINDENKILLDNTLIDYYNQIISLINIEKNSLSKELENEKLYYTFNIVNDLK